jgi:hypothetical protein
VSEALTAVSIAIGTLVAIVALHENRRTRKAAEGRLYAKNSHRRIWLLGLAASIGVVVGFAMTLASGQVPRLAYPHTPVRAASAATDGAQHASVARSTTTRPTLPNSRSSATGISTPSSRGAAVGSPKPPGEFRLVAYDGVRMTASIPAGWKAEESEARKSEEVESKWTDPAETNDYLLIDERQATHLSPEQDAAPVHASTEQSRGYREIFYGAGDLTGVDSWMWMFQLPEAERIDYFFERCTNAFGVLGSSNAADFEQLRPMFRAIAQSVRSTCR